MLRFIICKRNEAYSFFYESVILAHSCRKGSFTLKLINRLNTPDFFEKIGFFCFAYRLRRYILGIKCIIPNTEREEKSVVLCNINRIIRYSRHFFAHFKLHSVNRL